MTIKQSQQRSPPPLKRLEHSTNLQLLEKLSQLSKLNTRIVEESLSGLEGRHQALGHLLYLMFTWRLW